MEITEYKVRLWDDQRLRALVTVVFDNCFVVRNIKVIEGRDQRLFVAMPSRRLPGGGYADIAHPITREFRQYIEKVILTAYHGEREAYERDPSAYSFQQSTGRAEGEDEVAAADEGRSDGWAPQH